MQESIRKMSESITKILAENEPSVYLYGSVVSGDFRSGWSDIDILVLTRRSISDGQASALLNLRDEMDIPYARSFEGGMLSLDSFLSGAEDTVVYWGSSGQRISRTYVFDSFCMTQLLQDGVLLQGDDVRAALRMPSYGQLCDDVRRHYTAIRCYARKTERNVYSYGWMLDIARGIYTLRTGRIAAKTAAGEWALAEGLCPDPAEMELALRVRKAPLQCTADAGIMAHAEAMGPAVQHFADVLQAELELHHA